MRSTYSALTTFLLFVLVLSCSKDADVLLDILLERPSAPVDLKVDGIESDSFQISWSHTVETEDLLFHNVYLDSIFFDSTIDTTLFITNLEPETVYEVFVTSVNKKELASEKSATLVVTTLALVDGQAPTAPLDLSAVNTTTISTNLSWSAATDNSGVAGYKVFQDGTEIAEVSELSYSVTGLIGSTQYTFTVAAFDADGNVSAQSSEVTVTTVTSTDSQSPTVPSDLSASNTTVTSTNLSWSAATDNSGIAGYKVFQDGTEIAEVSELSYSVTGLIGSTQYTFTVAAFDADGNVSTQSSEVTVTTVTSTDSQSPTTPSGLSANNTTVNSTNLSWSASTDNVGVTGYKVFQNGNEIGEVSDISYSVTGLNGSTDYTFTVVAFDADGNVSAESSEVTVTTVTSTDSQSPTTPSGLSANNTTVNSTNLSWSASTDNVGVTGYKIFQNGNEIAEASSTSYSVTGLVGSTEYTFAVVAFDSRWKCFNPKFRSYGHHGYPRGYFRAYSSIWIVGDQYHGDKYNFKLVRFYG